MLRRVRKEEVKIDPYTKPDGFDQCIAKHILQVVPPRKNLLKYLPSFEGLTFLRANETALCGKV